MNDWTFEIVYLGVGEPQATRAVEIVDELAEADPRVGEQVGMEWRFEFGMTELDQEAARAEVKRMLADIDLAADAILDVRVPA